MSDHEMDNNPLANVDMSLPQKENMEMDQVEDSDLSGNGIDLSSQEEDFPNAQIQESDPSALEAFANELEEAAREEERLSQEAAAQKPEVQELLTQDIYTQDDAMGVTVVKNQDPTVRVTEDDGDTVMQSVEQDPSEGLDLPELPDTDAHMPDLMREQSQQYDPTSLFVPEHEPSPGAAPAAPSILSATPTPLPKNPFSFDRIRQFQLNLQRLNAASKKPASNSFANPLLNPAAQRGTYLDSGDNGPAETDFHQPAPEIDEDEKLHKEATAKFQKQKRY